MSTHPTSIKLPFASRPVLTTRDYDEAEQLLNNNLDESRRVIPVRVGMQADIRMTLEALPDIKLFGACWGAQVQVRSSPLACWHGILPLSGAVSCINGGQVAAAGEMLLFAPEHQVDVTWHDGTRAVVVAVKASLVRDHLGDEYQQPLSKLRESVITIHRDNAALSSLGHLLKFADAELAQGSPLLGLPSARKNLQSLLCDSLLQMMPALQVLRERSAQPGMVKRALDFIHSHLEVPLDIEDLIRVSGASRRSLEQAFRHNLNTSPMRYVMHCRLAAARECLRRGQPGELQLADLAYRYSFSQPSHFTTAYKQAFGELPSDTLRRR